MKLLNVDLTVAHTNIIVVFVNTRRHRYGFGVLYQITPTMLSTFFWNPAAE